MSHVNISNTPSSTNVIIELDGLLQASKLQPTLVSAHTTPILKSLHWLKINQRIEYRILSLTYKVLTTAQPGYLRNLIYIDSPHIETRSSSSVTLSRPSSSSSLKITDRSFRYASLCPWNKLP